MEHITCNMIQDLLPSYQDQILQANTKQLIEQHLQDCDSCRQRLQIFQEQADVIEQEELEKGDRFRDKLYGIRNYFLGGVLGFSLPFIMTLLRILIGWIAGELIGYFVL